MISQDVTVVIKQRNYWLGCDCSCMTNILLVRMWLWLWDKNIIGQFYCDYKKKKTKNVSRHHLICLTWVSLLIKSDCTSTIKQDGNDNFLSFLFFLYKDWLRFKNDFVSEIILSRLYCRIPILPSFSNFLFSISTNPVPDGFSASVSGLVACNRHLSLDWYSWNNLNVIRPVRIFIQSNGHIVTAEMSKDRREQLRNRR